MSPPATVTDANCGLVHEPSRSGPPVNCATGGLAGRVTADPIFCNIDAENAGEDLAGPEVDDEDSFDVLVPPETAFAVAAQPIKLGIVILTPAQS